MIEAALLTLELLFVILLLWAVNRSSQSRADVDLGIFSYKEIKTDADLKNKNKRKPPHA